MHIDELDFDYPEYLVATERVPQSRVMLVNSMGEPRELESGLRELINYFKPGDLLVVNNTRVLKRRIFSEKGLEILFIRPLPDRCEKMGTGPENQSQSGAADRTEPKTGTAPQASENRCDISILKSASSQADGATTWQVLCPASRWKPGTEQVLPDGVRLELIERGKPQIVHASRSLTDTYFEIHGEMPLPPYIQKARGERRNRAQDSKQYQTTWAKHGGSLAAPTASLHFSEAEIKLLKTQGIDVVQVTLHVGLGTFLPITAENLDEHVMHAELAEISPETWSQINAAKARGGRVWALGTTVTRTLEAAAHGKLPATEQGGFHGETDLFIRPGFEFKIVDRLLTNFHQPRSTLVALVGAFAGLERVKSAYRWAVKKEFRLFSYGDLTVWMK